MPKKLPSGPIDDPKPCPTLAREVAAADNEVIKSSCVVESNKVIIIKEFELDKINPTDVVYTDTWFSMGDIEDSTKIEMLTKYTVNQDLMSKVNSDCMFMNCLPANRSQEVSSEVIDGSQSYVWQEAQNRLHVQKELLLNFL